MPHGKNLSPSFIKIIAMNSNKNSNEEEKHDMEKFDEIGNMESRNERFSSDMTDSDDLPESIEENELKDAAMRDKTS